MGDPKASVVMSVYNGERYLREAVESILNQTFTDFEFIIIDDGSTDNTTEILEEYATQDKRIRLIRNTRNLGLTRSLNKGLRIACGEYLARQDADDISLQERLALQVRFLDEHPDVGVVGTWVMHINEGGRQTGVLRTPTSPALVRWFLLFGPCLMHPSVTMRRSLLERDAAYRPEIPYAQDYDLWVRLSTKTQLANLPEVLQLMRVHRHAISAQHYGQQEQTARAVMQHAIMRLLGEEVPETLVARLRHVTKGELLETTAELQAVASLIVHLYQVYTTRNMLNATERRQVAEDAAYRLAHLAVCHIRRWPLNAGRVLLQALRLNPRLPTKKLYLGRLFYSFLKVNSKTAG
jgi:glycosyltransferase involved in cell wall biosynthesis